MFNFLKKTNKKGLVDLYATIALNGSSVASVPTGAVNDFSVVLTPTKTGRYTLSGGALADKSLRFVFADVNYEEVADAAIGAAVLPWAIRDNLLGTNAPSIKLQFLNGITDTAIVSRTIRIHLCCQR